jgi:serine/threonine protein phosphatase PrpC
MLSDGEIEERLHSGESLEDACRQLVQDANTKGGLDNITVVLVQVED